LVASFHFALVISGTLLLDSRILAAASRYMRFSLSRSSQATGIRRKRAGKGFCVKWYRRPIDSSGGAGRYLSFLPQYVARNLFMRQ
jgi:hypothetical protein